MSCHVGIRHLILFDEVLLDNCRDACSACDEDVTGEPLHVDLYGNDESHGKLADVHSISAVGNLHKRLHNGGTPLAYGDKSLDSLFGVLCPVGSRYRESYRNVSEELCELFFDRSRDLFNAAFRCRPARTTRCLLFSALSRAIAS